MFEHLLRKTYITITDVMTEERIDLAYSIWDLDSSKKVVIVSMFSDNIQHQIKEPLNVMLKANKEKWLLKGVFMGRELNASIGRKLITTPLDANDNVVKMDKLACVTEMVLSLDELDNTDNLEGRILRNVLLKYHVTGSEEFTGFEPLTL